MLRDTYGYEVIDENSDPVINIATEALNQFSRTTTPPYYMVEFIPARMCLVCADFLEGLKFE